MKPLAKLNYGLLALLVSILIGVGIYIVGNSRAAALPGDATLDGKVDVFDLSKLLSVWGTNNAAADFDSNGTVNVFDLSIVLTNWGKTGPTPSPTTATPTPTPGVPYRTDFGVPQHEDGKIYNYPNLLNFGPTTTPPTAKPAPARGIEFIAHWYNDFGLDSTALSSNSSKGWWGWYDWRWNFPTNTGDGVTTMGYDPANHPIQGFYKGDNANVLGWQTYWLAEAAGLTAVALTQSNGFTSANWSSPSSSSHWVYQLFHNVPNFKALKYALSMKNGGTAAQIEAQNVDMVNTYKNFPSNAYVYVEDGKRYAVVTAWDLEETRGVFDAYNGQTKTVAYLKGLASKFKAIGYDGVFILARRSGLVTASPDPTLKAAGAYVMNAAYEDTYNSGSAYGYKYSNYAASAPFPTGKDRILNVVTSAKTQFPHGSGWKLGGSTPQLFKQVTQRAVNSVVANGQKRMITIYNVSEWAEGGPGLIPQKRDGFGYLDAVRTVTVPGQ